MVIETAVFLFAKNPYVKEKARGWTYVTGFLLFASVGGWAALAAAALLAALCASEGYGIVSKIPSVATRWAVSVSAIAFTGCLFAFFVFDFGKFFQMFVAVSFSDIAAYFVGTKLPYGKGFTKLSPNKAFSGVAAQAAFLSVAAFFVLADAFPPSDSVAAAELSVLSVLFGVLAPVGDLAESFAKRQA